MAALSNYLENKLIDHVFRNMAYSVPTGLWVALFTVAPSDAGGGTEVSLTDTNYGRVQVGPSYSTWQSTQGTSANEASSGTGGATQNVGAIQYLEPSTANWGTIVAFGIFDASTGGNLLIHGAISPSKVVNASDPAPSFPVGALDITWA